jgi:hypothetical protein
MAFNCSLRKRLGPSKSNATLHVVDYTAFVFNSYNLIILMGIGLLHYFHSSVCTSNAGYLLELEN